MGNSLYGIAVVLILAWAIAFFEYGVGGVIHLLLVMAAIVIVVRIFQGRKIT
jgi:NADH:ubiquinone oxidoreductase subunit 3 (subunit A)